jgi:hypothetical protein
LKENKMNTRVLKASLGLTIVLLLISACGIIPTFGSRTIITQDRPVTGFDRLDVSGSGGVSIVQDGTESLTIATDDNVMQYVTSEVRGGTLYVGLNVPGQRPIIPSQLQLTLHVKHLSGMTSSGSWNMTSASLQTGNLEIATSGSGKVNISALTADKLTVNVSGSGNIQLAGTAASQQISISGSGKYLAGDLQTKTTSIDGSGSCNVTVWATTTLNASVSGSGTIGYYGSPQVTYDQSGSGNIKSLGTK